ncbi:hypothetical protein B7L17_011665 [Burkholderia cenocepacia]|uniref:hypothetical protein n=1 Tax=Burkholderia cenocepacia TaxID=95486 RepID=UPI0022371C9D|nr:hypothetical protein [Burkholderia cenocepacia]MCW5118616.1 hypothetical protein [Burkholderia cenocepacia]MCW5130927.1 hypothetical protein [Burkholderia cenocepacia]MCW5174041.1 hypothetical protein [Burkholderia cenocepacia]
MNNAAHEIATPRRPRLGAKTLRQVAAGVGELIRGDVSASIQETRPAAPLRSASPQSVEMLRIVSDAVRAAALAPTDRAALDVTGDALRRLADLARAEVAHG